MDKDRYIKLIKKFARVEQVDFKADLLELGIDSLATIELLLEIENEYEITFPDEMLTLESFGTPENIWNTIENLVEEKKVD